MACLNADNCLESNMVRCSRKKDGAYFGCDVTRVGGDEILLSPICKTNRTIRNLGCKQGSENTTLPRDITLETATLCILCVTACLCIKMLAKNCPISAYHAMLQVIQSVRFSCSQIMFSVHRY